MASFNRLILVGNLTRDLELRYTQGGTAVTDVGLAVNDRRKNQAGETIEETAFVDVTLWGRTAEVAAEYLAKGSPVLIEGRLKLDTWEFLEGVKSGGSIAVVDDDDQLQCGVTPYYRANEQERATAWQRLEAPQQKVGRRMAEKGITEDDIDRVLQQDD